MLSGGRANDYYYPHPLLTGNGTKPGILGASYRATGGATLSKRSKTKETTSDTVVESSSTEDDASSVVARHYWSTLATVAKWIRRIVSAVLVLAAVAVVTIASVALVQGTWQVNPVVSGSMRPGFAVGGIVISERIPMDQLALRDVMVFKNPLNPSNIMVHRIVVLTKNKSGQFVVRTQGDANNVKDPWTLTIHGKYVYIVRWSLPLFGYASVAYQNHRGLVLLATGVILLALASTTIFRPRRRGERQSPDDLETNDLDTNDLETNDPLDSPPANADVDETVTSSVVATSPDLTDAPPRKHDRKKKSKR